MRFSVGASTDGHTKHIRDKHKYPWQPVSGNPHQHSQKQHTVTTLSFHLIKKSPILPVFKLYLIEIQDN